MWFNLGISNLACILFIVNGSTIGTSYCAKWWALEYDQTILGYYGSVLLQPSHVKEAAYGKFFPYMLWRMFTSREPYIEHLRMTQWQWFLKFLKKNCACPPIIWRFPSASHMLMHCFLSRMIIVHYKSSMCIVFDIACLHMIIFYIYFYFFGSMLN